MNSNIVASESKSIPLYEASGIPQWKRPLDLCLLLLLLPAIVLFFVAIAILIKLVSRGPVFFTQERVGLNGRKFRLFKFRTMHPNANAGVHAAHVAAMIKGGTEVMRKLDSSGDKRMIPFGRHLRASGLDELPQLINVLKGEMSIVGPRPCTTYEYDMYEPRHRQRCNALPGLTGLWQVSGKNRTTFEQMIDLDIQYANNPSLSQDIRIIALTFPTLMGQVAEHVSLPAPSVPQTVK
jgi:lipopolysaccharide/colanic/teichoic acid biosynthesis glycosyltransferase